VQDCFIVEKDPRKKASRRFAEVLGDLQSQKSDVKVSFSLCLSEYAGYIFSLEMEVVSNQPTA
jgi:hypothetical protein